MTPLTNEEMNISPEEFAQAFAEDPSCIRTYLLAAEERGRRAALRERDAAHEAALMKARADALEEAALLVERRQVAGWVPHGAGPAFAQLASRIRALLEEAGK